MFWAINENRKLLSVSEVSIGSWIHVSTTFQKKDFAFIAAADKVILATIIAAVLVTAS